MKHMHQRNIKIIDELLNFCYRQGANNISLNISNEETETIISLSAVINDLDDTLIDEIIESLNTPRYHEMEEYYWSLSGDDFTEMELNLVGMMTDSAEISYENNILNIKLIRSK